MMIPRRDCHTLPLLLAASLLLTIAFVPSPSLASHTDEDVAAAFHCPETCSCSDLQLSHHREVKHARCESIEGLQDKQWPVNSLDLSGLGLTKVPAVLEKLRNLSRLDLSSNNIAEVARLSHRVQELNLGHNKIGSGKLAKLPPQLKKLNLTNNHITVVPAELKRLEHLRELELAGNPINCSCETIQVRNWLVSRHVWTEKVIKCALPLKYKGRPWLQVKQSDVCVMTPTEIQEEKNIWEDSNDLMMGDQPAEDHHDEDALEDEYLPFEDDARDNPHTGDEDVEEDVVEGSGEPVREDVVARKHLMDVEGSGGSGLLRSSGDFTTASPTGKDDEEDEEEGSGGAILPPIGIGRGVLGGIPPTKSESDLELKEEPAPKNDEPIHEPTADDGQQPPETVTGLGIFNDKGGKDSEEAPIVKETAGNVEATVSPTRVLGTVASSPKPETADSTNLYIMLAVILVVMVSLIIIVVCKQKTARNRNNNNRMGNADVENAKLTELQDMNDRMIGKPLEKRGNGENAPLIGEREKSDFARPFNGQRDCEKIGFNPYEKPESPIKEKQIPLKSFAPQEKEAPVIQANDRAESQDSINENGQKVVDEEDEDQNNNDNKFQPIQNGYPHENGDVAHQEPVNKSKRDEDWEKYTPRSPDMKRYSPVYSPETGRVKIKLTETAKPKTPLLVTRSRSNAGQMITTPNLNQRPQRPVVGEEAEVQES